MCFSHRARPGKIYMEKGHLPLLSTKYLSTTHLFLQHTAYIYNNTSPRSHNQRSGQPCFDRTVATYRHGSGVCTSVRIACSTLLSHNTFTVMLRFISPFTKQPALIHKTHTNPNTAPVIVRSIHAKALLYGVCQWITRARLAVHMPAAVCLLA